MSEQEQEQVPEVELPKAGTFDLGEWLDKKSTYPKFSPTVYLDGESAAQVSQIDTRLKELEKTATKAEKEAYSTDPFASVADPGAASQRHSEAVKQISQLQKKRSELVEKLKTSAVTLTLSMKDDQLHKRVEAEMRKRFAEELKNDHNDSTYNLVSNNDEAANMQGVLQLKDTIQDITNAEGKKANLANLTTEGLERFMNSLTNSDRIKVMRNMNLAITGGNIVDQAIDAGFPG